MNIKQKAVRGKNGKKPAPPWNRGFKSLEVSSRKHRRAEKRLAISQTVNNRRYPAGTPVEGAYSQDDFTYHSGGRVRHY